MSSIERGRGMSSRPVAGEDMGAADREVHVRITGRVQGVFYRAWTGETARALGLAGWVRNCRDGGVEAVFSGSAEAVAAMIGKCRRGPPAARVENVEILREGEAVLDGQEAPASEGRAAWGKARNVAGQHDFIDPAFTIRRDA